MFHFFRQALNPVNSLLQRLKNWKRLCISLAERPRKRLLKMEELLNESGGS